jgi:hypothetical protein
MRRAVSERLRETGRQSQRLREAGQHLSERLRETGKQSQRSNPPNA